jgi:competence protein ComEC
VARPDVLISDTGRLVGVLTGEGRALSRARGDGFVAGVWLENDGDGATQEVAAARDGWWAEGAGMSIAREGLRIWHGAGRRALAEAASACATHDLVILSEPAEDADPPMQGETPAIGHRSPLAARAQCRRTGRRLHDHRRRGPVPDRRAIAIEIDAGALTIRSARGAQGDRLWTR